MGQDGRRLPRGVGPPRRMEERARAKEKEEKDRTPMASPRQGSNNLLRALSRLVLRREDTLQCLATETDFFVFSQERLRRVLRKKSICRTTSHLHLHIFTSAHLHSHLYLCSCSHLHIYISAHVHICTSTSLLIFTSSHRSSHIFTSRSSLLSLLRPGAVPPEHHETQPSAEIVRVEGAKCRRECVLARSRATLCGDRACRGREMQARVHFGSVRRNPLRRSRVSRARKAGESAFWPGPARPCAEIVRVEGAKCRRECVLDWSSSTFGGRLVRKRSFWRLGASLLEDVSYEALVLETWRFTFGGSLVRKRNARFGDLALHFWRKSRTAFRSWTQKWPVCSAHVVWERAFWSWTHTTGQLVEQM